jgi:hypothetical protein
VALPLIPKGRRAGAMSRANAAVRKREVLSRWRRCPASERRDQGGDQESFESCEDEAVVSLSRSWRSRCWRAGFRIRDIEDAFKGCERSAIAVQGGGLGIWGAAVGRLPSFREGVGGKR